MLDLIHIRTLTEIVDAGSFSRAANRLGYTASAVSQQVAALERSCGIVLFEREANRVRPTAGALLLADRGKDILVRLEALTQDARTVAHGSAGRLVIGSFPTSSARIIPAWLAGLVTVYPNLEIRLEEGEPDELLASLIDGRLDMALVYEYDLVPHSLPETVRKIALVDEDLLLLMPPRDSAPAQSAVKLSDLADEAWIATREGTAGLACLHRLCAEAGFTPQITLRSNDYGVVRGLVQSGLGVALIPAMAYEPTQGVGVYQLIEQRRRHTSVLYREANTNPALPNAMSALQESLKAMHVDGVSSAI